MEFLNKVELKGLVGAISTRPVCDATCTKFSVVTETAYNSKDGACVIDCCWFSVVSFNAPELKKGTPVHVVGRMKYVRYCNQDGVEVSTYEVIAKTVELINE